MKYLKRYNIYGRSSINESVSLDIIEDVEDILLELNDIGFQSKVDEISKSFLNSPNKDTLLIFICKYDLLNSEFGDNGMIRYEISDVKDVVLRLNRYLSKEYPLYSIHVNCKKPVSDLIRIEIDELDEKSDYVITNMILEFSSSSNL